MTWMPDSFVKSNFQVIGITRASVQQETLVLSPSTTSILQVEGDEVKKCTDAQ